MVGDFMYPSGERIDNSSTRMRQARNIRDADGSNDPMKCRMVPELIKQLRDALIWEDKKSPEEADTFLRLNLGETD
jgi:hypothetical protein